MAITEERIKELKDAYAKATNREEFQKVWELGRGLEAEMVREQWPRPSVNIIAKAVLVGYWARYYELKKFQRIPEEVNRLHMFVRDYFEVIDKRDVELVVGYGCLLSAIIGQLLEKPDEVAKIDREISGFTIGGGNFILIFQEINAQGLNVMKKKDWSLAIEIFSRNEQVHRSAITPGAKQYFANILSNRGLSKLNLSDERPHRRDQRDLISSAIVDLREAGEIYMEVVPPPLKHIDGLENRFIMAAIRLLLTEHFIEEAEIAEKIQEAFGAEKREEAKKIIFGIKELNVKAWNKIEGNVPGDTWVFIRAIQLGLKMADEFLAKHKEEKQ